MSEIELHRGTAFLNSEDLNRLARQQELSVVIAKASIFDEICQAVELSEEREAELVQTFLQRHSITSDIELEEYLKLRGWQEEDLIYVATKAEKLRYFQEKTFSQEVELSYLGRKIDIDIVDYTLLSVKDSDEAFELHQRLQEDEATPEELKPLSRIRQTSSLQSGFYGPQPISSSHPCLIPLLRVGHTGQLWPPFFQDGLWIIARLNQRNGVPLDDELYSELLDDLFERWLNERVSNLITGQQPSELPKPFKSTQTEHQKLEGSDIIFNKTLDQEEYQAEDSTPKYNSKQQNNNNSASDTSAIAKPNTDQTDSNQCEQTTEPKERAQF